MTAQRFLRDFGGTGVSEPEALAELVFPIGEGPWDRMEARIEAMPLGHDRTQALVDLNAMLIERRNALTAAVARAEGELDAAWAEAEAALPEGWQTWLRPGLFTDGWEASGRVKGIWRLADGPVPETTAAGPTPAAALRALAAALREKRP